MGVPIIGVQAAQQARKKLPRGKVQMYVTPGWEEDEPEGPGQQYPMTDDAKKKLRKLQRV
jgi:hypothetical protein